MNEAIFCLHTSFLHVSIWMQPTSWSCQRRRSKVYIHKRKSQKLCKRIRYKGFCIKTKDSVCRTHWSNKIIMYCRESCFLPKKVIARLGLFTRSIVGANSRWQDFFAELVRKNYSVVRGKPGKILFSLNFYLYYIYYLLTVLVLTMYRVFSFFLSYVISANLTHAYG